MRDRRVEPLWLGTQGPLLEHQPSVEVGETEIPDRVSLPSLSQVTANPTFAAVETSDMIFAGRIPGSTVDLVVFPVASRAEIGLFAFDGDLAIVLATVSEDTAPACLRSRVDPPERVADIVVVGPLDAEVSVVVLGIDGDPVAAVRPRARFAAFDTLGVARTATIEVVAYDRLGTAVRSREIGPLPPQ